ncbi:MAG: argininosuccinate lyase [Deltaproteobacteria bacterium]|jgi:argininosuccinate lyase|nr:argininosuccinate lyase [Deltaproteobacteria bacterium]
MNKKNFLRGRFEAEADALAKSFTQSVSHDRRLYLEDIAGSVAHARMLAAQGIITREEADLLVGGLERVRAEIEAGDFVWKEDLEDVHMNIESRLTELVGEAGKKLHTGRSRNDQVALDFRLFVSRRLGEWAVLTQELMRALTRQAEKGQEIFLPGYTHLQAAQPVSLAQHLLAYAWMFKRDVERMRDADKRTRVSPLGAAALAGTSHPLDPLRVARDLRLEAVFDNSMDAVSDRDFALEAMFCASLGMAHLSRLCEDIILWANPAFGFVRLPDAYSTSSSIMPQKKNPDVAELARGKTGQVYGALLGLLTTLKGLPMTYNRDLQEDKAAFFMVDDALSGSLRVMAGMAASLDFRAENMRLALAKGYVNATELADYLVSKGIPFRDAHGLTGAAVSLAEKRGVGLEDLPLDDLRAICPAIDEGLYPLLAPETAVRRRTTPGGTGPESVKAQLTRLKHWLA